jgi:formamidopyrimidine-DNA glycosylase
MPELPEVAGLRSFLQQRLQGAVLDNVQVTSFSVLKTADPPYSALVGRTLTGVQRFGKFVDLVLGGTDQAEDLHLVFHLAKAGWVRFSTAPSSAPVRSGKGPIAARLLFRLPDTSTPVGVDLTEAGTKKSLAMYVVRDPAAVPGIASLGPDPLLPGFTEAHLASLLAGSGRQLKGLLRDQGVLAGIGNAYSDEILHAAKMSPFAPAKSVDPDGVATLYAAIENILGDAVRAAEGKPASELKDAKRSAMRVHAREGQACPVCGDEVRTVSFADTSLQYCATCQTNGKILADRRTSKFLK